MRELLDRFEKGTDRGGYSFFDSGELEDIIFYYLGETDLTKARKAIDFAVMQYPAEVTFQVFEAQYYLNNAEPEKALARLNSLETTYPLNPDIVLTKATVLGSMHRHSDAIKEYEKALKIVDEDLEEIHTSIAFEYQNMQKYSKALDHLKKAFQLTPDDEGLLYEIGYCCEIGDMSEEAATFFLAETDKRPYSSVAWYNLGMAYSSLQLFEKSIDAFDYAIAIDPTYTPAYFSKAQCYEQMEMYIQAIHVYKQTFEYEQPDAMTQFYIGDCYSSLEKYEVAIEYFRKSVSMERHFSDAWMGIGICFSEMGRHTEALSHMEQAIKLEPDNAEYFILLAETQLALGMAEKAETAFEKASTIDPYHPDIWLDYSAFYAETHKNYTKALEVIDEGIFYQSDNSSLAYRRVAYLTEAGRIKEAIVELFIALTMDYEAHAELLEYSAAARVSNEILTAIESFRNHNGIASEEQESKNS